MIFSPSSGGSGIQNDLDEKIQRAAQDKVKW
jgi:hypothetical protein